MNSSTNPGPSPFVRGTADTTHVYMIAAGARRLIPDDQTLKFLLAGQTVRVLSDADLAAIPLGAPMPSRKDGQIVSQDFGGPVPGPLIFYSWRTGCAASFPISTPSPDFAMRARSSSPSSSRTFRRFPRVRICRRERRARLTRGAARRLHSSCKPEASARCRMRRPFVTAGTIREPASDRPGGPGDDSGWRAFSEYEQLLESTASGHSLVLFPFASKRDFRTGNCGSASFPDDVHVNSFEPNLTSDEQAARRHF